MKRRLLIAGFGVLVLLELWLGRSREPLRLVTDPAGAEVWADGYYLGSTPLIIDQDLTQRQLEIQKDGYLDLIVEASALPSSGEVFVRLFPDSEKLVSDSPYYLLVNRWISGDWRWLSSPEWGQGVKVVNPLTLDEILLKVRDVNAEHSGEWEIYYGAVVSPDGFHVTYLEAQNPAVHCYFGRERLWLTDLIEPIRREDVFNGEIYDVPACSLGVPGYDFSPSGDWLWAKAGHLFSDGFTLIVFNVDYPSSTPRHMGAIDATSPVAWSSDETKLAFHDRDNKLYVYERDEGEWTFLQPQWRAAPLGWTSEDHLWAITADFEMAQLILLDVDTNETMVQIDLGVHYRSSPHFWLTSSEDQLIVQFWGYPDGVVKDRSGYVDYFDQRWLTVFVDLRGTAPQYQIVDSYPLIIDWVEGADLLLVDSDERTELWVYPELNCVPPLRLESQQPVNCSDIDIGATPGSNPSKAGDFVVVKSAYSELPQDMVIVPGTVWNVS